MLLKFYFKTNELVNYDTLIRMTLFICYIYVTLHFVSKINDAPVLKYYSDVMMRCLGDNLP